MCGGIRFSYDPALESVLAEVFPPEQLAQARERGIIETVFWQRRPVLPVLIDDAVRLYDWGNRDDQVRLPKTGWVRQDSLEAGKWDYLHPCEVVIPAQMGVEKRVWFAIRHGIRGYLMRRGDTERIYMLTVAPSPAYRSLTGHDRMPALINQDTVSAVT